MNFGIKVSTVGIFNLAIEIMDLLSIIYMKNFIIEKFKSILLKILNCDTRILGDQNLVVLEHLTPWKFKGIL